MDEEFGDWGALEAADHKGNGEDFDRLCRIVVSLFAARDGLDEDALFRMISKDRFREEMRRTAEQFTDRHRSKVIFAYLRMKLLVLPREEDSSSPGTTEP